MADDVTVTFSASIEKLITAVDQVKDKIASIVEPLTGIRSAFGDIGEVIAGAFAAEKVAEFVGSMAELGERTERTMAILGATSEEVGQLGFIAAVTGTDAASLYQEIERFQLSLAKAQAGIGPVAAGLKALGLSAKDFTGVPIPEQIAKLAEAVAGFRDGPQKTAAVMAALGKGSADMIPLLDKGREGIDELAASFEKTNSGLTSGMTAALAELSTQITTMKASVQGVTNEAFAPFITATSGFVQIITDIAQSFSTAMKEGGPLKDVILALGFAFEGIATAVVVVVLAIKEMWNAATLAVDTIGSDFVALGQLIAGVWTTLAAGAANFFQKLGEAGAEAAKFIGQNFVDLGGVIAGVLSFSLPAAMTSFNRLSGAASQAATNIGASLRQSVSGFDFSHATDGFNAQLAAMDGRYKSFTVDVAADAKRAVAELNTIWGTQTSVPEITDKPNPGNVDLSKGDGGAGAKDAIAAAMAAIDGQIKVLRDGLNQKKAILDQEVAYGQITAVQKVAQTKTATDQEYALELALLQKELAMLTANDDATLKQKQTVLNKIAELQATHTTKMIELNTEEFNAMKAKVAEFGDAITSGMSGQISGLISGTTTWKNAFVSAIQSIETSFIQMMLKVAANWAETKIAMLLLHVQTETAMTGATDLGNASRILSQATAAVTGTAIEKTSTLSTISADAAKAAAGAYAAVAQIPLIGPILAPIAAGVAFTAVEAFGVFDKGSWQLPSDMMAMVHKNEMIVPAAQTPWVQSLITNAGGGQSSGPGRGGDTTHVHVHGAILDGRKLTKIVSDMMNQDRSLRPVY